MVTEINKSIDPYFINLLRLFVESASSGLRNLLLQTRLANLAYEEQSLKIPNINWMQRQLFNVVPNHRATLELLVFSVEDYPGLKLSLGSECSTEALRFLYQSLSEQFTDHLACCSLGSDAIGLLMEKSKAPTDVQLKQFEDLDVSLDEIEFSADVIISRINVGALDYENPEAIVNQIRFAVHHVQTHHLHMTYFDPRHIDESIANFHLLRDLSVAIDSDQQLELYLQPKVCIDTGEICGAEALIRWNHPSLGMVMPGQFVPLAEQSGVIEHLDIKVLQLVRQALQTFKASGIELPISFNATVRDLGDEHYLREIRRLLQCDQIDTSLLEMEVTESMAMKNYDEINPVLKELRSLGCLVSIDDFGTGYSSLSHIINLEASRLKIDRSIVVAMTDSEQGNEVVDMILSLANRLRYDVVAEGIETEEQHKLLLSKGCHYGQGYFYYRPMPMSEFIARCQRG